MRLTPRDITLLRDLALSHVMSRDQLVTLGYFGSVTRANTRLRILRSKGLVSILSTPFIGQFLYVVGPSALDVVGERVASVLRLRAGSPRFIQHALTTTETRMRLLGLGYTSWRFEAQLRHEFTWAARRWEVRPDGLVTKDGVAHCVEVDLGHVAPGKFREKLIAYDSFDISGEGARIWKASRLAVLTVTTGSRRARKLASLVPPSSVVTFRFMTFDELGAEPVGGWS